MEDLYATLKSLQLALQTLLKKHANLKKENEHLKKLNEAITKELLEKNKLINAAEEKNATLNINELYSFEEKELLQSKIDIYLKDIEKCLALLNA